MNSSIRDRLSAVLLALALILAIGALALWVNYNEEKDDREVAAIFGDRREAPSATPAVVVGVLAGVSALSGVIFLATSRPED